MAAQSGDGHCFDFYCTKGRDCNGKEETACRTETDANTANFGSLHRQHANAKLAKHPAQQPEPESQLTC